MGALQAAGRALDRSPPGARVPHYLLGLNFLVANQIDPAIDELNRAAQSAGDPLEIHLILGNLYREKGQVGRAIQEHQLLLQRPDLTRLEQANVLLCLGLDYKRGGFVDRALEAFTEVLRLDVDNEYALTNLEKLYEEQHQWADAYATRQKLAGRDSEPQARHQSTLAFLENELGLEALKRMDYRGGGETLRRRYRSRPGELTGLPQSRRRAVLSGQRDRRGRGVGTADRSHTRARVSGLRAARRPPIRRWARPAAFPTCAGG